MATFGLILSVLLYLAIPHAPASIYKYGVYERSDEIIVYFDGERLEFDIPPMIIDERVMVSMRELFEAFGAPVSWREHSQTIHTQCSMNSITLRIDDTNASLWTHNLNTHGRRLVVSSGRNVRLDVPPQVIDDSVFVPLRDVSRMFGAVAEWDEDTRTVYLRIIYDGYRNIPQHVLSIRG
ncbi:MAG: copper amine oxidase N-terminal domain-containing protein [Defluviitaleaceae bacterium]|nr:copper amine oxidase N-terminal domain-containing protein [Defluviitaleaceae bacterium]